MANPAKYVKVSGAMVAKPISVRVGGSWKLIQSTPTGRIYLSPTVGTYHSGDTISVAIHADSLTTPVNAVQANITYPAGLLQFQSISTSGSPFPSTLQNTGGSGSIQLGVGSLGTDPTGDNIIGTITFAYLSTGSASLSIAVGSAIYRSSDSANILNVTAGATYTLV